MEADLTTWDNISNKIMYNKASGNNFKSGTIGYGLLIDGIIHLIIQIE